MIYIGFDHQCDVLNSMYDYHPEGPRFDSLLYPKNFSENIGSGTESTEPREKNTLGCYLM